MRIIIKTSEIEVSIEQDTDSYSFCYDSYNSNCIKLIKETIDKCVEKSNEILAKKNESSIK